MRNFQQKNKLGSMLRSKPVLIFLSVLALLFAWGVVGFMRKMEVTRENRQIAENKMAELEKEKEKLSNDITKLKTNEGIEESIREKFGLAKEGERLIVVVEDKNPPPEQNTPSTGFFSFLKNLFK